jgi:hypothetical protein
VSAWENLPMMKIIEVYAYDNLMKTSFILFKALSKKIFLTRVILFVRERVGCDCKFTAEAICQAYERNCGL